MRALHISIWKCCDGSSIFGTKFKGMYCSESVKALCALISSLLCVILLFCTQNWMTLSYLIKVLTVWPSWQKNRQPTAIARKMRFRCGGGICEMYSICNVCYVTQCVSVFVQSVFPMNVEHCVSGAIISIPCIEYLQFYTVTVSRSSFIFTSLEKNRRKIRKSKWILKSQCDFSCQFFRKNCLECKLWMRKSTTILQLSFNPC